MFTRSLVILSLARQITSCTYSTHVGFGVTGRNVLGTDFCEGVCPSFFANAGVTTACQGVIGTSYGVGDATAQAYCSQYSFCGYATCSGSGCYLMHFSSSMTNAGDFRASYRSSCLGAAAVCITKTPTSSRSSTPSRTCSQTPVSQSRTATVSPSQSGSPTKTATVSPTQSVSACRAPLGSFCSGNVLLLCPLGTFSSVSSSTSCQQCPGGYYCPPGTSSWARLSCGRGNYCPIGSGAPTPCPIEVPPSDGWGALQVQGPAFLVDTSHCVNHCFWNFTSGDGRLSRC
jgi:hypothetical protein